MQTHPRARVCVCVYMFRCVCICLFKYIRGVVIWLNYTFYLHSLFTHTVCLWVERPSLLKRYQGQVTAGNRDNCSIPVRLSCETVYRQTSNHETPLRVYNGDFEMMWCAHVVCVWAVGSFVRFLGLKQLIKMNTNKLGTASPDQ